jgi:hypothetical protein
LLYPPELQAHTELRAQLFQTGLPESADNHAASSRERVARRQVRSKALLEAATKRFDPLNAVEHLMQPEGRRMFWNAPAAEVKHLFGSIPAFVLLICLSPIFFLLALLYACLHPKRAYGQAREIVIETN